MQRNEMENEAGPKLPEESPEVAGALTDALGAASPHRPPADLRARVLRRSTRRPAPAVWRLATVAVVGVAFAGLVAWNLLLNQQLATAHRDNPDLSRLEATNEVVFDVVTCRGGHVTTLRATKPGSASYGKLYTCSTSDQVVFMSGKLQAPGPGQVYELWLTRNGQTSLKGRLRIWPSLAGSHYFFGAITFRGGESDPSYEKAQLTLQAPNDTAPDNAVITWSG